MFHKDAIWKEHFSSGKSQSGEATLELADGVSQLHWLSQGHVQVGKNTLNLEQRASRSCSSL